MNYTFNELPTDDNFQRWLLQQPANRRQFYVYNPHMALADIEKQLVQRLTMLAQAKADVLTPASDNMLVLSVGHNQPLNREQMGHLRESFRNAVGEDLNSKVVIVALDVLESV